uniref:Uncharacterized protein n=1 Tax=Physarum polycephalum TaxID=5791 RepID=Q9MJ77_PHYPO|nr:hypothetical protein PhpooMp06 [Physarum polycephalum]BAB08085.1 unnamed protein product [Physarum polycephalum]
MQDYKKYYTKMVKRIIKIIMQMIIIILINICKIITFKVKADEKNHQEVFENFRKILKEGLFNILEKLDCLEDSQTMKEIVETFMDNLMLEELYIKYLAKDEKDYEGFMKEIQSLLKDYLLRLQEMKKFKENMNKFTLRITAIYVISSILLPHLPITSLFLNSIYIYLFANKYLKEFEEQSSDKNFEVIFPLILNYILTTFYDEIQKKQKKDD